MRSPPHMEMIDRSKIKPIDRSRTKILFSEKTTQKNCNGIKPPTHLSTENEGIFYRKKTRRQFWFRKRHRNWIDRLKNPEQWICFKLCESHIEDKDGVSSTLFLGRYPYSSTVDWFGWVCCCSPLLQPLTKTGSWKRRGSLSTAYRHNSFL